jgi:hypothetical protein
VSRARLVAAALAVGAAAALVLASPAPASASPTVPHDPKVPAGIGNGQVIVLRPHRADLVRQKAIVRVVPLSGGAVTLETLVRAIGDERWATMVDGTATLKAGLLQRPHTDLRVGPAVHTLVLLDSPTSPAYLAGSSASVAFAGVTVVSSGGSGPAPESDHRPYVRYGHGSTVSATGATFQALGTRSTPVHHGFVVGSDSSLMATDAAFKDSGRGLDLYHSARASLTRVTASGNAGPGVAVDQARNVTLGDVGTSGNATGVLLRGPLPGLTITGTVAADHNTSAGVEVVGLGTGPLGPLHTDHNQTGLLVRDCPGCVLVGLASTGDQRGVTIARRSTAAVVRDGSVHDAGATGADVVAPQAVLRNLDVTVTEGATGVRLGATASGAHLDGGTVSGGRVGVSIAATRTLLTGVTVADAWIGVRVGGRADGTVLRQVSTNQNGTGLVTQAGPATVTASGLHVQQSGGQGVRSAAASFTLDGASISGATIGLNLTGGHATVSGSTVMDTAEAVHADHDSRVQLTNDVLGAHVLGLRVARPATVTLTDCTVSAPLGARGNVTLVGSTSFPALPLSWLGLFALVALAVAVALELARKLREHRHEGRVRAPAHVTNTA